MKSGWQEAVMRISKTEDHENENRRDLKYKRNVLFKLFLKHPTHIQLAAEIRALDDQLAERAQRMSRAT